MLRRGFSNRSAVSWCALLTVFLAGGLLSACDRLIGNTQAYEMEGVALTGQVSYIRHRLVGFSQLHSQIVQVDLVTGKERTMAFPHVMAAADFAPDGSHLITSSSTGSPRRRVGTLVKVDLKAGE